MIDRLPEHRTLPDDVRVRARRRLSEGMRPGARTGVPALVAAGVSLLAAGALVAGQALLGGSAWVAGPPAPHNGEFTGKDRAVVNHVERGAVHPDALARCAAAAKAHPPAAEWRTIATSRKNGTTLTAFRAPAGVFFCANTTTSTTISAPDPAVIEDGRRRVRVLFTTPTGALAGLVSPDLRFLTLSRIGDRGTNTTSPALVDGLFLAPAGFTKAENGTLALADGDEFAVRGVPKPTQPVIDRPLPPADRGAPGAQQLARCLEDRPVPDAAQFHHTLTVRLSATSTVHVGRFEDLLFHCVEVPGESPRGDVHDSDELDEVRGVTTSVAALAAFYDFTPQKADEPGEADHTASSTFAAIGLVTDERVASITYTRPGAADVAASIADGTFVLAAPLIDRHPEARVVVRDAAGAVLETIKPKDVP
ncbi:hypothetical protein SAMN05216188_107241 [Lentzea xinjiangensis]|uniref:Uncharacterized protein n=1 Tax=Lentzea xinjiangensis TaxID=402600 RepID=A0A1H9L3H7_9PSEU|nr:hypothetical protein [Lentzea xinjiangensis]SER06052.1 hypothetical protein SAMN05216188_107241 [Lentzea xinjiangensis]